MESIIASIITGGLALIGIIITNAMSNKQIEHKLEINQAITDTKLDNLNNQVSGFVVSVQQVPVISQRVDTCEKRLDKLENKIVEHNNG